jgi:hypothetical protein
MSEFTPPPRDVAFTCLPSGRKFAIPDSLIQKFPYSNLADIASHGLGGASARLTIDPDVSFVLIPYFLFETKLESLSGSFLLHTWTLWHFSTLP